MRLRVKLFATYREIVGERELRWSAEPGTTVEVLLASLFRRYPDLAVHRDSMMLAVNHAFAAPSAELHEGDEVALLPPVSGGAA